MMHGELYQYLTLYKQLSLPGIGTFRLEQQPAVSDFPNRLVMPPMSSVSLQPSDKSPSRDFFSWLAAALGISDRDAIVRFNDFVFDLKQQLSAGSTIQWDGVGTLSKGLGGGTRFEPALKTPAFEIPVVANKVIREKSEHTVRVGEDERTSAQMRDLLSHHEAKRKYWWAWAVVIAFIAIIFTGWYFSEHGLRPSASGNTSKIKPGTASPAYKKLP